MGPGESLSAVTTLYHSMFVEPASLEARSKRAASAAPVREFRTMRRGDVLQLVADTDGAAAVPEAATQATVWGVAHWPRQDTKQARAVLVLHGKASPTEEGFFLALGSEWHRVRDAEAVGEIAIDHAYAAVRVCTPARLAQLELDWAGSSGWRGEVEGGGAGIFLVDVLQHGLHC